MKGSVTISIEDYENLRNAQDDAQTLEQNTRKAAKELQVFLSFLCSRGSIEEYVQEFNRQSKSSTITIVQGIALIKFIDDKN